MCELSSLINGQSKVMRTSCCLKNVKSVVTWCSSSTSSIKENLLFEHNALITEILAAGGYMGYKNDNNSTLDHNSRKKKVFALFSVCLCVARLALPPI